MTVRQVFLQAKGICAHCGYPKGTHRGDCQKVETVTIRRADVETLRSAVERRVLAVGSDRR